VNVLGVRNHFVPTIITMAPAGANRLSEGLGFICTVKSQEFRNSAKSLHLSLSEASRKLIIIPFGSGKYVPVPPTVDLRSASFRKVFRICWKLCDSESSSSDIIVTDVPASGASMDLPYVFWKSVNPLDFSFFETESASSEADRDCARAFVSCMRVVFNWFEKVLIVLSSLLVRVSRNWSKRASNGGNSNKHIPATVAKMKSSILRLLNSLSSFMKIKRAIKRAGMPDHQSTAPTRRSYRSTESSEA
jgi:hypothetical protein